MSRKWRSSKKVNVDGLAFKRARLTLKRHGNTLRGEYSYGAQEWLAEQAKLSLRTVNELETGSATLKTVDAVSQILAIKGRQYIKGYGEDFTAFRATGVVDFRPTVNGCLAGYETAYLDAAFLVTLDPLAITVDDDFIDKAKLQKMELRLSVGEMNIDFNWLYNVTLTSRASTWLGDEEDVSEIDVSTREPYQSSVMFKQSSLKPTRWKQFVEYIRSTDEHRILLTLKLVFEHFEKQDHIMVSVEEIKSLFEITQPQGFPYWMQPKALMV